MTKKKNNNNEKMVVAILDCAGYEMVVSGETEESCAKALVKAVQKFFRGVGGCKAATGRSARQYLDDAGVRFCHLTPGVVDMP